MPVFINNVDDYLGPSQACVNPLFEAPPPPPSPPPTKPPTDVNKHKNDDINGGTKIATGQVVQNRRIRQQRRRAPRIIKCEEEEGNNNDTTTPKSRVPVRLVDDNSNSRVQNDESTESPSLSTTIHTTTTTQTIKKKATVTLSDCLSCSGCVTSAEAVLMSHHSIDTLREVAASLFDDKTKKKKKRKRRRIVFTISSASLSDLYRHLYLEKEKKNDNNNNNNKHDIMQLDANNNDDEGAAHANNQTKSTTTSSSASSVPVPVPPTRHEVLTNIASFLQTEFNAHMIIDGSLTQHVSLMESASEFCYRYRKTRHQQQQQQCSIRGDDADVNMNMMEIDNEVVNANKFIHDESMPSVALSSTKTRYINKQSDNNDNGDDTLMEVTTLSHPPGLILDEDIKLDNFQTTTSSSTISTTTTEALIQPLPPIQSTSLPVLTSSCPGFVCLVEKTVPSVVPLLSSVKSPMAVAGVLIKTTSSDDDDDDDDGDGASDNGTTDSNNYYHVAIMPCHDKKLEAGRGDFAWEKRALLQYCGNNASSKKNHTALKKKATTTTTSINVESDVVEELVNEVDLVLTTGELLEVLSDAAAASITQCKRDTSTLTTMQPSFLSNEAENDCTSTTTDDIRNLLLATNNNKFIQESSVLLKTVEGANYSSTHSGEKDIELDTGVHGSGSYADYIFRHAAQELFGCNLPHDKPLPWKSSSSTYTSTSSSSSNNAANGNTSGATMIRRRRRRQETTDLREVTLYEHYDGSYSCEEKLPSGDVSDEHKSKPMLRFATAYGFKNVQLILQSLSKTETTASGGGGRYYDYVEVMACPSGCSNGGGQIGANGNRETPRETKERVKKTVSTVPILRPPTGGQCHGSIAETILCGCKNGDLLANDTVLRSKVFDKSARQLFHTRFHVVPKLELSTGATAGVALNDTKW